MLRWGLGFRGVIIGNGRIAEFEWIVIGNTHGIPSYGKRVLSEFFRPLSSLRNVA